MSSTKGRNPADTNLEPSNRQGTRTNTAFNTTLFAGNTDLNVRVLAKATNKHWAKAKQGFDTNTTPQGRIVRACYKWILQTCGEHCDDLYYGNP